MHCACLAHLSATLLVPASYVRLSQFISTHTLSASADRSLLACSFNTLLKFVYWTLCPIDGHQRQEGFAHQSIPRLHEALRQEMYVTLWAYFSS